MSGEKRKKILVPIFFRGHLGRLRSVLSGIRDDPRLELQIMAATSQAYGSFFAHIRHSEPRSWRASLPWYVKARALGLAGTVFPQVFARYDPLTRHITREGFAIHSSVPFFFDGGTSGTMAKSVGIGIVRIADELKRLKPDMVLINGDRFEMMAAALAAAYLNVPIAHHEGGDVSGTIDESVRHAVTKLAHVHLAATETSRRRVIQMGEDPRFVFTVGSPAIDMLAGLDRASLAPALPDIDQTRPYLVVMVHPVTTGTHEENLRTIRSVIAVLERLRMQTVFIGGNSDAYSRTMAPVVAQWLAVSRPAAVVATKLLRPDRYYTILARAACAIGNSSSFIREGAYLGVPAVLVGDRQQGREHGENTMEVAADPDAIARAVEKQLAHGPYPSDARFGVGDSGKRIVEILKTVDPPIQKRFHEVSFVVPDSRGKQGE
ncbi:MAG: UDP-N-acetylglucosamine 2-epimerase [Patescibacteria group bacterium]